MVEESDIGDEVAVGDGSDTVVGGEVEVGLEQPDAEEEVRSRFDIRNLLPEGVKVQHLKELKSAAKLLDQVRRVPRIQHSSIPHIIDPCCFGPTIFFFECQVAGAVHLATCHLESPSMLNHISLPWLINPWKYSASHGDLLTFLKMRHACLSRVSSVTAVGRLEFLGPFRLGLFHLVTCENMMLHPVYSIAFTNPPNFFCLFCFKTTVLHNFYIGDEQEGH